MAAGVVVELGSIAVPGSRVLGLVTARLVVVPSALQEIRNAGLAQRVLLKIMLARCVIDGLQFEGIAVVQLIHVLNDVSCFTFQVIFHCP